MGLKSIVIIVLAMFVVLLVGYVLGQRRKNTGIAGTHGSTVPQSDINFERVPGIIKYPADSAGEDIETSFAPSVSGGNSFNVTGKLWTEKEVIGYINGRFDELNKLIELKTAFSFVLISAFADFLSCVVSNKDSSGPQINKFFNKIIVFTGKSDNIISNTLSEILRNGSVHNFSVNPTHWEDKVRGGQVYHVVLTHKTKRKTHENLSINAKNELVLVAEDMVDELRGYIETKYDKAEAMQNMVKWFNTNPPIYALSQSEETPNVVDLS